jgi:DNA-binding MarR family transcriptional regulator
MASRKARDGAEAEPAATRGYEKDAMFLERVIAAAEFQAALRRFLRHSERIVSQQRLTPQRYLLLLMIKGAPDGSERLSVGAVADRLQLGVNTTTELIKRAESNGLVRRERSDTDARVVYLRLTAEGERRLEGVMLELDADRHQLEQALRNLTRSFRRTARP